MYQFRHGLAPDFIAKDPRHSQRAVTPGARPSALPPRSGRGMRSSAEVPSTAPYRTEQHSGLGIAAPDVRHRAKGRTTVRPGQPELRAQSRRSSGRSLRRPNPQECEGQRQSRGGRSMRDVRCPGWATGWSAGRSGELERSQPAGAAVKQPRSVWSVDGATGACGEPGPCEHASPEHGEFRRGSAGVESAVWTLGNAKTSSLESDSRVVRLALDVTP